MRRLFTIIGKKPPIAEFPVSLDLSAYLGTQTILSVSYDATNLTTQTSAATSILDNSKSSNGTSIVKPWIRGGTPGNQYKVLAEVTINTTNSPKDRFGVIVDVDNV